MEYSSDLEEVRLQLYLKVFEHEVLFLALNLQGL
jgi:hypothetical protein